MILNCSYAAMHAGKDEGGGQIIYYEPGMQDRANRALVIEAQLHQALDSGRFEVFYQPLIEVSTLKFCPGIPGFRALPAMESEAKAGSPQ